MSDSFDFVVKKDDFHETAFLDAPSEAEISLLPEQALLRIDSFSLTANNITYAAVADMIGYWKFFPTEEGWGRIPAWGFAEVVRSGVDGLAEGDRIYGYLPMSKYLVVEPTEVGESGFIDATPHRADLPAAYNRYSRASKASDKVARDAQVAIFAPLFATSFMLDDWLTSEEVFGSDVLVVSSASSKTALALAWLVNNNSRIDVGLVGLTSPRNVEFVESTGLYDRVVAYPDIDQLDQDTATTYLDFSGSRDLKQAVHNHFGDSLKGSIAVGVTAWDKIEPAPDEAALPGAAPVFFFAPEHIARRTEDWGGPELWKKIGVQQEEFIISSDAWLHVKHGEGRDAIKSAYLEVLDGKSNPADGWWLSP